MPPHTGTSTSTILFWNIRAGGGPSRAQPVLLEILSHEPDVVALCECRSTFAGQLIAALRDQGLPHHLQADAGPRVNRVVLVAREALEPELGSPTPRVVHARTQGMLISVCHVPDASNRSGRLNALHELHRAATGSRDEPHLILGDFNADRTNHPRRDGTAIGRLTALGYADLWLTAGGDQAEPTWTGPGGAAARLDHAYASKPLVSRVESALQIHAPRELGWSDHSLLKLRLIHNTP